MSDNMVVGNVTFGQQYTRPEGKTSLVVNGNTIENGAHMLEEIKRLSARVSQLEYENGRLLRELDQARVGQKDVNYSIK